MIKIQNYKPYGLEEMKIREFVSIVGYWNLMFICNLFFENRDFKISYQRPGEQ
jgi:hypothetical protein